ncbi:SDR family NAD(P)-dependent oxidoreductase [Neobacillus driksii]|uniref:SDR family NAD(P)-dependent oxidoreductase n=1 Tax=Neobacillus driksii TaxID=3035913 RepID=UPI0027D78B99|nr:SDR family NAD(P)-dependent oxidoreductase [Neobacillus niacini]
MMKKAVVVGGSNGIGLAIAENLISKGYHACILDICEPNHDVLKDSNSYTYYQCNLLDFNEDVFEILSKDERVEILMITAGFGRVADFEFLHTAEIENMLKVNTISAIKIMRIFYEKIKSNTPFYCGVMGSIAGLCSSPMFSVYAASKAGVCRFVESVNIELEAAGVTNRILNVSPGSIKGTKFNGGSNNIELTADLAEQIVGHVFGSDELFIPDYNEVYKGVLERYNADPHEYGLYSYNYKKASGRVFNEKRVRIGYLSGTFDLFHVGHLNLLKAAKAQCDYLIVGVHPSAAHKGKETFIPFEERKVIVGSIKYVDKVVQSCPEDSDAWDLWRYTKLFVGSDYKGTERFNRYEEYFRDKGVDIVYFPYTQGTSSTEIRKAVLVKTKDIDRDIEVTI